MKFKQICYDTQPVGDRAIISFFTERDENEESVTSMTEAQAVEWLFHKLPFKRMFLKDFFENPNKVKSFFGKAEPFTNRNKKPGDIDLLLVNTERPDRAIAFECKRVKVTSIDENISKVNNAEKIKKGVIQANKYQSLGFHQSYLMIILLEDGREVKTPNTLFRYSKSANVNRIYDIPQNEPIHKDVGIVFVNVNQTTGKHINSTGTLGFCIDKEAQPLEQMVSMTNKIKDLIKNNELKPL